MESNLVISLDLAKQILAAKQTELRMLDVVLQGTPDLDDQLIVLFAEFWNVATGEIEALEKTIADLEQQNKMFGGKGFQKELVIDPEDYPRKR